MPNRGTEGLCKGPGPPGGAAAAQPRKKKPPPYAGGWRRRGAAGSLGPTQWQLPHFQRRDGPVAGGGGFQVRAATPAPRPGPPALPVPVPPSAPAQALARAAVDGPGQGAQPPSVLCRARTGSGDKAPRLPWAVQLSDRVLHCHSAVECAVIVGKKDALSTLLLVADGHPATVVHTWPCASPVRLPRVQP